MVINKKFIMAFLAAMFVLLPGLQCFANGAKEPTVVVSVVDDTSLVISIDWSAVSKPEQYNWGLYRYDLEDKTYTLVRELEAFESSYTDEDVEPPINKYYYKIERAPKNAALDKVAPRRVSKEDVQKQMAAIYGSGAAKDPTEGPSAPRSPVSQTKSDAQASFFNEGIYIGIISFSGKVKDITHNPDGSPALVLLDSTGRQALIENLNRVYLPSEANGTALYYAGHKALANLAEMKNKNSLPSNVDSVTVITFTDGTDTSSTDADFKPLEGMSGFNSAAKYRSFIKQQFSGNVIGKRIPGLKKFRAWAIGIPGKDIQNEAEFTETLQSVASAPEYAEEIYEFSHLNAKLMGIAEELLNLYRPRINLTISTPAYPVGTLLRITFDEYSAPDISEHYIDLRVSWDAAEKAYAINPVDSRGTEIADGRRRVYGKRNETGIDYTLMLSSDFNESNVMQWYIQPGEDAFGWRQNSEFITKKTADFTHERKSEIIYLVLDSSSSLTEKEVTEIRQAVTLFINKLYNSLYGTNSRDIMIAQAPGSAYPRTSWQTDAAVSKASAQTYRPAEQNSPSGTGSPVQMYQTWTQPAQTTSPAAVPQSAERTSSPTSGVTVYQSYQKAPSAPTVIVQNPSAALIQSTPPVSEPPVQVWQRTSSEYQFPPLDLYQKPSVQVTPRLSPSTGNSTLSFESAPQTIVVERLTTKTVSPQNRYWVQIGSYSDTAYAQRSWRAFSNTGMGSAEIFVSNVNGVTHYRVKAGPYIDKTEAENALVRLKNYSSEYKDCFVTSE
jgi:cell division protein FtsN